MLLATLLALTHAVVRRPKALGLVGVGRALRVSLEPEGVDPGVSQNLLSAPPTAGPPGAPIGSLCSRCPQTLAGLGPGLGVGELGAATPGCGPGGTEPRAPGPGGLGGPRRGRRCPCWALGARPPASLHPAVLPGTQVCCACVIGPSGPATAGRGAVQVMFSLTRQTRDVPGCSPLAGRSRERGSCVGLFLL